MFDILPQTAAASGSDLARIWARSAPKSAVEWGCAQSPVLTETTHRFFNRPCWGPLALGHGEQLGEAPGDPRE